MIEVPHPEIVNGVMTVNRMPLVVICEHEKAKNLAAYVFQQGPQMAILLPTPWPISETHQGFIFPKVDKGKHLFILVDCTSSETQYRTWTLKVIDLIGHLDDPDIIYPGNGQNITGTRLVAGYGIFTGDPSTLRAYMNCNSSHQFPGSSEVSPSMVMGHTWYMTAINVDETNSPPDNPFKYTAHPSSGSGTTRTGINFQT